MKNLLIVVIISILLLCCSKAKQIPIKTETDNYQITGFNDGKYVNITIENLRTLEFYRDVSISKECDNYVDHLKLFKIISINRYTYDNGNGNQSSSFDGYEIGKTLCK